MLTVTAKARQHLKELWLTHACTLEMGLRLALSSAGQFGVLLDQERPGDYVVAQEGAIILLVGPELAPIMTRATMDLKNTPQGRTLVKVK